MVVDRKKEKEKEMSAFVCVCVVVVVVVVVYMAFVGGVIFKIIKERTVVPFRPYIKHIPPLFSAINFDHLDF